MTAASPLCSSLRSPLPAARPAWSSCRCEGWRQAPHTRCLPQGGCPAPFLVGRRPTRGPRCITPLPPPETAQAILKGDGPGPEAINGRLAMLALPLAAALEVAGSGTLVEQAGTPAGAAGAAALALAVAVASLAPALAGKVPAARVFPSVNDAYPTQQLPYFWTALAETINGRCATPRCDVLTQRCQLPRAA